MQNVIKLWQFSVHKMLGQLCAKKEPFGACTFHKSLNCDPSCRFYQLRCYIKVSLYSQSNSRLAAASLCGWSTNKLVDRCTKAPCTVSSQRQLSKRPLHRQSSPRRHQNGATSRQAPSTALSSMGVTPETHAEEYWMTRPMGSQATTYSASNCNARLRIQQ